jgi:hypothetical protein
MKSQKINKKGGFWPTEQQILLLKCVLYPLEEALNFWKKWLKLQQLNERDLDKADYLERFFDPIDIGSERIMPLIHARLSGSGDPFIERLQGHRRKTWIRNAILKEKITEILKAFDTAGIEHMLLKGLPLALEYYGDLSIRPMWDGDILLRPQDKEKAVAILTSVPFNAYFKCNPKYPNFTATSFILPQTDTEIDLHWHLFQEHADIKPLDPVFWESRIPLDLGTVKTTMMSPTHLFFHVLIHGRSFNSIPPFRWIADCIYIARLSRVDWDEILRLGVEFKYIPFIKMAVNLLKHEFSFEFPESFLESLQLVKSSRTEIQFQNVISSNQIDLTWFSRKIWSLKYRYFEYKTFRQGHDTRTLFQWIWYRFLIYIKARVNV